MNGAAGRALLLCGICLFALIRCASSPAGEQSKVLEIRIEQLPETGFEVQKQGAQSIAYQMTVHNHAAGPITLRAVRLHTVGRSPYQLRDEPAALSETIAPDAEATIPFSLWSYARDTSQKRKSTVWTSGSVMFDGPSGAMRQDFTTSFREP